MSEVRVGLAGVGYWGSKLARNLAEARGARLVALSDGSPDRLEAAGRRYPGTRLFDDVGALVACDEVDAVVLATPAAAHAQHARAALEAGKHVMVEKPLALSVDDCDAVIALAEERGLTLMVGHTFVYSEPVRVLRRLIHSGELGRILYVHGQRVNLGVIREDLNALWNFGPHDVSILLFLLGTEPTRVSARQFNVLENRSLEDIAFLVIEFPQGVVGHLHDSWLDPRKVRSFTVVGDRKMVVYDDTDVETPLRIYDKGVTVTPFGPDAPAPAEARTDPSQGYGEFKLEVRAGDMLAPKVAAREPLRVEVEHFVECVATGERPLTDGHHGRQVVSILEAADRSTRAEGRAVEIAGRAAVG